MIVDLNRLRAAIQANTQTPHPSSYTVAPPLNVS